MARKRPVVTDALEASGAALLFFFFRLFPLDAASWLGGAIARLVGPRLGITKRARDNLRRAMPELAPAEVERISRQMWNNLGRVTAEYAHLRKIRVDSGRIEIDDRGGILGVRHPTKRYIFFSAHYGNWEILLPTAAQLGFAVMGFYRAANNPLVDRLIAWARGAESDELAPKGTAGAVRALAALREGRELCMLIDQKMNDGIAVPFFGRPAMTASALALLALRNDCVVVPVHIVRVKGAHFRMILEPPLELSKSGDAVADRLALMTRVNAIVEGWLREEPSQWLWLHRRWPD